MVKNFLIICLAIVITSCGTTMYNLKTPCEVDKKNLFDAVTGVLIQEGFNIQTSNPETGLLIAKTSEDRDIWTGTLQVRVWTIQVNNNNEVTANAKVLAKGQNAFGATTSTSTRYYNDNAHEEWTWYWNVRDAIAENCGGKIRIVEKKLK